MLDEKYNKLIEIYNDDNLANLSDQELIDGERLAILHSGFYRSAELVTKRLANSIYGVFGTNSCRYFLQELAADICSEGRYYIKAMDTIQNDYFKGGWLEEDDYVQQLKEQSFGDIIPTSTKKPKLIDKDFINYCDTDSTYTRGDLILESLGVNLNTASTKNCTKCLEYIFKTNMNARFDKYLEDTITKRHGINYMDFELELIGSKGIYVAKKKYILTTALHNGEYVADKGWFKSTGIEIQQSGSSDFIHKVLKSFMNVIFTKWRNLDERTFFNMCKSLRTQLANQSVEELSKFGRIRKYDEYIICDRERIELRPKAMAAVRGAARYNHLVFTNKLQNKYQYLKSGMRIRWYYDINNNPFAYPDDVFPSEFAPEIGLDTQLEKLVFNPVKRLAEGLFKANMNQMGREDIQFGFKVARKHSSKIK